MTVYIYLDKNSHPSLICSYNPFVVYLGSAGGRTSVYYTTNCSPTADFLTDFPELFI